MDTSSPQTNELAAALTKAQAVIESAIASRENDFFQSSYANLSDVWDACRKPITDNGLSITQSVHPHADAWALLTRLNHTSGQWIASVYPLRPIKADPQSFGAAVTYARRFSLAALVGVSVTEADDDGNEAADRPGSNRGPAPKSGYVIKTGQHAGKPIASLTRQQAHEWLNQIIDSEKKAGKPLPAEWRELADQLIEYVGAKGTSQ